MKRVLIERDNIIPLLEAIKDARARWVGEGFSPGEIDELLKRFKELKDSLLRDHLEIMTLDDRDVNKLHKLSFEEFREKIEFLEMEYKSKVQPLKKQAKKKDQRTIYSSDLCDIQEVFSKAAMCKIGSNSDWCVTKPNQTYFEEYTSVGVMFRIIEAKVDITDKFDIKDFSRMHNDKKIIDMSKIAIAFKDRMDSPASQGIYMEAFDLRNNALNTGGILKVVRFLKVPIDFIYGDESKENLLEEDLEAGRWKRHRELIGAFVQSLMRSSLPHLEEKKRQGMSDGDLILNVSVEGDELAIEVNRELLTYLVEDRKGLTTSSNLLDASFMLTDEEKDEVNKLARAGEDGYEHSIEKEGLVKRCETAAGGMWNLIKMIWVDKEEAIKCMRANKEDMPKNHIKIREADSEITDKASKAIEVMKLTLKNNINKYMSIEKNLGLRIVEEDGKEIAIVGDSKIFTGFNSAMRVREFLQYGSWGMFYDVRREKMVRSTDIETLLELVREGRVLRMSRDELMRRVEEKSIIQEIFPKLKDREFVKEWFMAE